MTTMGLIKTSYKTVNEDYNYLRIKQLCNFGYIQKEYLEENLLGWTLTKKGFGYIKRQLPAHHAEGYLPSNPHHDLYATAFHLGEWYGCPPADVVLISENELASCKSEALPENIPLSQNHVPDGITLIENDSCRFIIGFELEISKKANFKYTTMASYYGANRYDVVFWCVEDMARAKAIYKAVHAKVHSEIKKHNFILFDDLKKRLWKSEIIGGQYHGQTMAAVLARYSHGETPVEHRFPEIDWLICPHQTPRFLRPYSSKQK